jgi:crotonobetainyl-CoA:carnitine CoA-transferase CaiB-like acyl-CoA transferase
LQAGVPCSPINSIDQVFDDPQVREREMVMAIGHPTAGKVDLAGSPLKFSRTPVRLEEPPPLLGQHTEDLLQEHLGYTSAEIAHLRDQDVI